MQATPDNTGGRAPGHGSNGSAGHRYFFVCGFQRSGTNWVGNLLNLHPKIHCHGEFHFNLVYYGYRRLLDATFAISSEEPFRGAVTEGFNGLVRGCLDRLAVTKAGAFWLGDRTPRELYPMLPGCPHFHVVRDGRDVLVSWTLHQLVSGVPEGEKFRTGLSWHLERFRENVQYFEEHPQDLLSWEPWVRHVAHCWAWRTREDMKVIKLIEQGELDASILPLKYERLHSDPEGERSRMYRFLGLEPGDAVPLSHETRTVPGFSENNPGAFFRRGKVGDWKRFDRPDARRWFMEEAGRELVALGYEAD